MRIGLRCPLPGPASPCPMPQNGTRSRCGDISQPWILQRGMFISPSPADVRKPDNFVDLWRISRCMPHLPATIYCLLDGLLDPATADLLRKNSFQSQLQVQVEGV